MKLINNIIVDSTEENCPADALLYDFRKHLKEKKQVSKYPKKIEIGQNVIKYWKAHADYYEENDNNIVFLWDSIPEEDLPPLKIKIFKEKDKWLLLYLKEYGDDRILIQGKQRKGKNNNGSIKLDKEESRRIR